jgi:outer membrane protein insertion porin family
VTRCHRRQGAAIDRKLRDRGNKDIKTEDLLESMRNVGLAPGRSFDRSVLDNVTQFLTQQYFERGKYAVKVTPSVTELPGNKVNVNVVIVEGARAKIRQINVVGNETFTDDELRSEFQLHTPHFTSFYKKDDRYAREVAGRRPRAPAELLHGSRLRELRRGIDPGGNLARQEGHVHHDQCPRGRSLTVSDAKITGDIVVPERSCSAGADQARARSTRASSSRTRRHSSSCAWAGRLRLRPHRSRCRASTRRRRRSRSTSTSIRASACTCARSISRARTASTTRCSGREMRQLEAPYLSNAALDRSEQRIRRLPFVEEVSKRDRAGRRHGRPRRRELRHQGGLPGQFGGGIGYSGTQGILLSGNFTHSNFMGTGQPRRRRGQPGRVQQDLQPLAHEPVLDPRRQEPRRCRSPTATPRSSSPAAPTSTQRR